MRCVTHRGVGLEESRSHGEPSLNIVSCGSARLADTKDLRCQVAHMDVMQHVTLPGRSATHQPYPKPTPKTLTVTVTWLWTLEPCHDGHVRLCPRGSRISRITLGSSTGSALRSRRRGLSGGIALSHEDHIDRRLPEKDGTDCYFFVIALYHLLPKGAINMLQDSFT